MTSDEKRLRIRRTRQGIVIASVVGSAGLATGLGVSAAAQDDDSQTGTVVSQTSADSDEDDGYWGDPPPVASGSGDSHASTGGS